jgi:DNA-binding XRE family transcriptional regulator
VSKPQIIYDGKRPAFAIVPYAEWLELSRRAEAAMTDEELMDAARAEDSGEHFPHDLVMRLVNGEPPLKVFREYRAMTQEALSQAAKVSTGYISQIERGTRQPSKKALAAFAAALELDPEDLA